MTIVRLAKTFTCSLSRNIHYAVLQRIRSESPLLRSYSSQLGHLMTPDNFFQYPFGRQIVSNLYNFLGIFGGACLGMFIIYTPPLRVVFGGSFHLSPLYWLIPCAFGIVLLAWASFRVVLLRKGMQESRVKDIQGLMMCKRSLHCAAL